MEERGGEVNEVERREGIGISIFETCGWCPTLMSAQDYTFDTFPFVINTVGRDWKGKGIGNKKSIRRKRSAAWSDVRSRAVKFNSDPLEGSHGCQSTWVGRVHACGYTWRVVLPYVSRVSRGLLVRWGGQGQTVASSYVTSQITNF